MANIKFGWIDYSSADRNKVISVLHALAEPGAVDELGIGLIRDGFADIFFPGTSTIQTRAKYYFIIPYILIDLERKNIKNPDQFLKELARMELDLIQPLKESAGDSGGVIGARAGHKLKRRPSSIYWSGLRTLEMFIYPHLSLEGYAKEQCKRNQLKLDQAFQAVDEEYLEDARGYWNCLNPNDGWQENISIQLTAEEAQYLKSRIEKSSNTRGSMYALMLENKKLFSAVDFASIPLDEIEDESLKRDYMLARDFSEFIFGATIRYNYILSNGRNEQATALWEEWKKSLFVQEKLSEFDYRRVFDRLDIRNQSLFSFVKNWKEKVLSGDTKKMDELVIKRERDIKGKSRAKLVNPDIYVYSEGSWFGGQTMLQYRFEDARKIITDINHALEGKEGC